MKQKTLATRFETRDVLNRSKTVIADLNPSRGVDVYAFVSVVLSCRGVLTGR